MQVEFAIDYIKRRMSEMGYENNYITRWRHIQLAAGQSMRIDADNEYYFLIDPDQNVSVKSKFGVYDMNDTGAEEMQYEHRGKIDIANSAGATIMVLFIQVIPIHKK